MFSAQANSTPIITGNTYNDFTAFERSLQSGTNYGKTWDANFLCFGASGNRAIVKEISTVVYLEVSCRYPPVPFIIPNPTSNSSKLSCTSQDEGENILLNGRKMNFEGASEEIKLLGTATNYTARLLPRNAQSEWMLRASCDQNLYQIMDVVSLRPSCQTKNCTSLKAFPSPARSGNNIDLWKDRLVVQTGVYLLVPADKKEVIKLPIQDY